MRMTLLGVVGLAVGAPLVAQTPAPQAPPAVVAIRAGGLLDPDAAVVRPNQIIVVEGTRIRDVDSNVAIPAGPSTCGASGKATRRLSRY